MNATLNVVDHSRDSAGMRYVYPVVSRRSGGVSVGINLNTNNACNWRCIYCQVPDLILGAAPDIEMGLLESELRDFLHELIYGNFMQQRVPEHSRRINDVALSGNGEPTSAKEFVQVVRLVSKLMDELSLPQDIQFILITNGSLMHRTNVQDGLKLLSKNRGEVWFKFDRASERGMQLVNNSRSKIAQVRENLVKTISLCPTWLQTCWFAIDSNAPDKQDEDDYLDFVSGLLRDNVRPRGVMLYSLARTSHQPEAPRLQALSTVKLEAFAARIRSLNIEVKVAA